jgi:hypothetical protein
MTEKILTPEQVEQFEKDGYILVPGILDEDQVERLAAAAEALVQQRPPSRFATFTLVEKGCIFDSSDEFRDVVLRSKLGALSAELMQLDPETQNCRVLRYVPSRWYYSCVLACPVTRQIMVCLPFHRTDLKSP